MLKAVGQDSVVEVLAKIVCLANTQDNAIVIVNEIDEKWFDLTVSVNDRYDVYIKYIKTSYGQTEIDDTSWAYPEDRNIFQVYQPYADLMRQVVGKA